MFIKFSLFALLFSLYILLPNALQNNDCSMYKSLWFSKKYPYTDSLQIFPSSKESFKNVCPSSRCCDGTMQSEMVAVSKLALKAIAEKHLGFISESLMNTSTAIIDNVLANIDFSRQQLNQMFTNTYTSNYKMHKNFFFEFYDKLKRYIDGKEDNLQTILDNFFADMNERIVGMMAIVKKDPDSIRCLANNLMKLDPYQGADKGIISTVLNSYPMARMFVNGMRAANDVFVDLIKDKTTPSWECAMMHSKAFHCPLCSGSKAKPCDSLCKSTIGKCLGSLNGKEITKLSKAWSKLMVAFENMSKKLVHPFNLVEINKNLHVKISDAIMNVHNFFPNVRDKIWDNCKSQARRRRRSADWIGQFPTPRTMSEGQSTTNDVDMTKLVKSFSTKMPELKTHLKKFRNTICSNKELPMTGPIGDCNKGNTASTEISEEPKQRGGNKNLAVDPLVKKAIVKLNEISSVLHMLTSGQNKDPKAFKIEFVPLPKKPANRPENVNSPVNTPRRVLHENVPQNIEGSGESDSVTPKTTANVELVQPIEPDVDGSGNSAPVNKTIQRPSFPRLPIVERPVATMKPVVKKPVIIDDEDLGERPVDSTKKEPSNVPIEGSGETENVASTAVAPVITTVAPVVTRPWPVQPPIERPVEGSGLEESGDDETKKTPRLERPQFPVVSTESSAAPTTEAPTTSPQVVVSLELPGDIPQEIWIPRVMDYDAHGRLVGVTTKGASASFGRLAWLLPVAVAVTLGS